MDAGWKGFGWNGKLTIESRPIDESPKLYEDSTLLWDVITYPCQRYLLLATKSSYHVRNFMYFNLNLALYIYWYDGEVYVTYLQVINDTEGS